MMPTRLPPRRVIVRELLVLAGFLAFAVFATWPLVTWMFTEYPTEGDQNMMAWNLWWVKEQVFALENPWVTDHLYAPSGTRLGFHTLVPLVGVVLSPLTALLGPGLTMNLTRLLIPVVAAYVVYRLARRLGLEGAAPIVAGGLYGFSTVIVWRADIHLNFAAGALMPPLAVLFAARYFESRRAFDAVGTGCSIGLAVLIDPVMAIITALAVLSYAIATVLRERPSKRDLRGAAFCVLAAVVVAAPQLAVMAREITLGEYSSDAALLALHWTFYNPSPLALLAPSPGFPDVLGLNDIMVDAGYGEGTSAIGWGLLLLMAMAVFLSRRRWLVAWAAITWLVATVLAIGPELQVGDDAIAPLAIDKHGYEVSTLLPYTWFVHLPGLAEFRVSTRFILLAILPAAILGGLGFEALRARASWAATAVLVLALGMAVLESGWAMGTIEENRLGISAGRVDLEEEELYAPIREDESDSVVVDVPLWFFSGGGYGAGYVRLLTEPLLRATEHEHPISNGYIARLRPEILGAQTAQPFYADLLALQTVPPDPAYKVDPVAGRRNAQEIGVGWVVLWTEEIRRGDQIPLGPIVRYLHRTGFRAAVETDRATLYRAEQE